MGEINNLANINVKGLKKGKPKLEADGFICRLYQNKKSLKDLEVYNKFIKKVESMVRKSKEYKQYKDYLMNDIGLDHCMVFPNIKANMGKDKKQKVTIEMHHGPLLTLYDSCCIITDHMLENNIDVTSIRVYKKVLDEHFENNIQVMMMCDLAHKLYHAGRVYINPKQAWGYTPRFLEKYSDGVDAKMAMIINKNLELAEQYNSIDHDGILDVHMTRWDIGVLTDDELGLEEGWDEKPVNALVIKK
jgi:hypothetical protein